MRGPYEDPQLDPQQTEQTRLRRCLLYGFGDYCGKGTKLFDVLTGDQELEVHPANYGSEIDQSQHAKSGTCYCKAYNSECF